MENTVEVLLFKKMLLDKLQQMSDKTGEDNDKNKTGVIGDDLVSEGIAIGRYRAISELSSWINLSLQDSETILKNIK